MEAFTVEHLSFSYPGSDRKALQDVSFTIRDGAFVALCGKSGCGKSTLLRHLKSELAPHGERSGSVKFRGTAMENLDRRTQIANIGYVLQSPDNQIVTDKVWHELAFGLESLGCSAPEIRRRVAETASFFGIQEWFHKKVTELSGGQKQLLNLASVMVMQPQVLLLDEPTSQLDPIAASEFLGTLGKINRELGITIVLTEHRLEEVLPLSDIVHVMDLGEIAVSGTPREVGEKLRELRHDMFYAMPTPMRVYSRIDNALECPVTVREGREFLHRLAETTSYSKEMPVEMTWQQEEIAAIELDEVWFKYDQHAPDVLKGLSLKVFPGELHAIVGGNGAGKTTALSLISGLRKSYRGKVLLYGRAIGEYTDGEKYNGLLGVLPQNPQALFVGKTVEADLLELLSGVDQATAQDRIRYVSDLCELDELLGRHPYDLSGGEQQRAALAKILLLEPSILLLDEPTKGLDAGYKLKLAGILHQLKQQGTTILMVSHDIDFCASFSDRCSMFFDGGVVSDGQPREFFSGNRLYTTAANRMARELLPWAVTPNEIIHAFGGLKEDAISFAGQRQAFAALAVAPRPKKGASSLGTSQDQQVPADQRKLSKRTLTAMMMIVLLIPLTIWFGIYYLDDRKYYFISMLVMGETILPFAFMYEGRKPQPKELVTLAVLCGIGVAGRMALFMVPQFKPVLAIVIISGVALGPEAGFLVGAVTGFVSNYYFGQGPWTPWQMFGFGIIGFMAGVLFRKGLLRRNRISLSLFGGIAAFVIYGTIMNVSSVFMTQTKVTVEMFVLACIRGIPFDLIHGFATVVFLLMLARPMLEKLDRVKEKYGLMK
ncbi:ECF transporter S component [Paenibacillus sp. CF384]|uniref:ECF transporter S component n=1 Tax=Paenibacillus sp. CF384 TaxID=1884382 RepID=UPI00089713E4|nr:ECF transporter S component [Paenibacillus sp. CF384]SDX81835.1 ABC-type glutathione transport system ATPase component, contains duplicated ATPase domain [Paenibacillus sp. CF384]